MNNIYVIIGMIFVISILKEIGLKWIGIIAIVAVIYLAICVLGHGYFRHRQQQDKKKLLEFENEIMSLESDEYSVLDEMTKSEVLEWFFAAPNLKKIDKTIIFAIVNELYGSPWLNIFAYRGRETSDLVNPLNKIALNNKYAYNNTILIAQISACLAKYAADLFQSTAQSINSIPQHDFEKKMAFVIDLCDFCIQLYPSTIPAYVVLALFYSRTKNSQRLMEVVNQGLDQIEQIEGPLAKSEIKELYTDLMMQKDFFLMFKNEIAPHT